MTAPDYRREIAAIEAALVESLARFRAAMGGGDGAGVADAVVRRFDRVPNVRGPRGADGRRRHRRSAA